MTPLRARRVTRFGVLCLLFVAASPLTADEVVLANGRRLAGVIAREDGDLVRVTVEGGELTLARSQVVSIVRGESALATYRDRRDALRSRAATAAEWLELARWALERELAASALEAALEAARLEPRLDGLAPVLGALDHVFAEAEGRWLSRDDWARAQGLIEVDGSWVTPEAAAAVAEARARERAHLAVAEAAAHRRDDAPGGSTTSPVAGPTAAGPEPAASEGEIVNGIPWWWVGTPVAVAPPPPLVVSPPVVVVVPPAPAPASPPPPRTSVRTPAARPPG